MSEYQYYEFLAIDRPLSQKEQEAVRNFSSRAAISATSFTNEYHWGDFKGDPHEFLRKWYDAHVYVANWGTRRFMFRVPKDLIDVDLARACFGGAHGSLKLIDKWAIIDLCLEPDDGGEWDDEDGSGWMSNLATARADLLHGDPRIFYLGWLLRAQSGEIEEKAVEPFMPAGLNQLSASLQALVDFLQIDEELLAVAAERSEALTARATDDDFAAWIIGLPGEEKDALLVSFCRGDDPLAATRLRRRFEASRPRRATGAGHRTVRQLLDGAERLTEVREQRASERAAAKRAADAANAAALREKHLDEIAAREPQVWRELDQMIAAKNAKSYDQAVVLLGDLKEVAARLHRAADFEARVSAVRAAHASKSSFMARLRKANF